MSKTILITGATGQQGGATLHNLLGQGFTLRALTRKPDGDKARALANAGVEVLQGHARITGRSREVHHYDKVPDGEDCRTVKGSCSESCRNVDNGNGSFSEVCTQTCSSDRRECTTRYREVPVYADRCSYDVDRWALARQAEALRATWEKPEWLRQLVDHLQAHACYRSAFELG